MFVTLSKLLDLGVSPLTWALALLVAALVTRRRSGVTAALVVLAIAILYVFSTVRVANALTEALEASARDTARPGTYDAVIVLSGMVDGMTSQATKRAELNAAADRIVVGFEIIHQGRARQILITGGPVRPGPGAVAEPELLAAALRTWGVEPERIVLETKSRNTHENAVESARIVAARGWRSILLVTSAGHMPRALGCFRKVGLAPDTLPVDHRAEGDPVGWLPRSEFLLMSTDALREFTGRIVYRIVGYT